MQIEHHDLHREFPEYGDRIHLLKTSNTHFAKLFDEYDRLDHQVRRIELQGSLLSDAEMEAMKMDRVHLKDKLYAYLKNG
jgi:uncharacterized protein